MTLLMCNAVRVNETDTFADEDGANDEYFDFEDISGALLVSIMVPLFVCQHKQTIGLYFEMSVWLRRDLMRHAGEGGESAACAAVYAHWDHATAAAGGLDLCLLVVYLDVLLWAAFLIGHK